MNIFDISLQKAKELFPQEEWTEIYKNVFVAKSRKPVNSEQEKVYNKEIIMAKIASDNMHTVFLLQKENNGIVYCYFTNLNKMYCWNMTDLK